MGGEIQGISSTAGQVKKSIRNREVKKLLCTTHGNERRGVEDPGEWGDTGRGGINRRKNGTTVVAQSIK